MDHREKWQLSVLLVAITIVALMQIAGVGSIIPLLAAIADPEHIRDQVLISYMSEFIYFPDTNSIVIFLAAFSLTLIVTSNVLSAFTAWFTFRFVWSVQSRLSTALLDRYLSHPYESLLGKNPAEAEKNVLEEVTIFTNGVMRPILRLIASAVVVVVITLLLVVYNPVMAGITVAFLGGGYIVTFLLVRQKLSGAGLRRIDSNEDRFRTVNEAIRGVKEIQVLGRNQEFVNRYHRPSRVYATNTALQNVIAEIPRYTIEVLAFGSVLVIALSIAITSGDLDEIIPLISIYAVAGYRLIPAMQRVYSDWSGIRFNRGVVEPLHRAYTEAEISRSDEMMTGSGTIDFEKDIQISDLSYRYPGSSEFVIDRLNLTIKRGHKVSFIGETGSGKTTLIDLLIGVLRPTSGSILIDDVELNTGNVRRWQNSIGYVPQDYFLIDDSIAANIAFGIDEAEIDIEAVRSAAKIANIDKFVMQELPEQYETEIGDAGVRLSGGQRQRIGIARALYHKPSILFLDEATSNLDQETENLVYEMLERVSQDMTVVIIAHRLKVTMSSDMIYVLGNGRLSGSGKYSEIVGTDGVLLAGYSDSSIP